MVLGDKAGRHGSEFLPWILFGRPLLLAQCVDLDVRLYYVVVQNLVYGCGNVPQVTTERSDTPSILLQQSVDRSTQVSAGLQCDPIQMAEVVQQEYVLVGGSRLYLRVNVGNSVHLSTHLSYCLQSQRRGRKDRPPERHMIADDRHKWITNTTTPQFAQIIPWCEWTQSLWALQFFYRQCILWIIPVDFPHVEVFKITMTILAK